MSLTTLKERLEAIKDRNKNLFEPKQEVSPSTNTEDVSIKTPRLKETKDWEPPFKINTQSITYKAAEQLCRVIKNPPDKIVQLVEEYNSKNEEYCENYPHLTEELEKFFKEK